MKAIVLPAGVDENLPVGFVSDLYQTPVGRLRVDIGGGTITGGGNSAAGTVGAAVPTAGDYLAFSNAGGTLVGVSPSNPLPTYAGPLGASGVTPLAGTFTGTGSSATFTPAAGRSFNLAVWATGGTAPGSPLNGTVYLARSIDGGTTFLPLTANGTQLETFTTVASETWAESQVGALYQLVCSAYTSGTINYRFAQ